MQQTDFILTDVIKYCSLHVKRSILRQNFQESYLFITFEMDQTK